MPVGVFLPQKSAVRGTKHRVKGERENSKQSASRVTVLQRGTRTVQAAGRSESRARALVINCQIGTSNRQELEQGRGLQARGAKEEQEYFKKVTVCVRVLAPEEGRLVLPTSGTVD
jgi:hypothetical protein